MRLGDRNTILHSNDDSIVCKLYNGATIIHERHRQRFEVNPKYISQLQDGGMKFVGQDEKGERMSVLELKGK